MTDISKKLIHTGLAALLFFSLTGFGFAQPNQAYETKDARSLMDARPPEGVVVCQMAGVPIGVPVEVLHSGQGFALRGNESHILRLNVETLLPIDPMQIRKLLASNKSIEEIRIVIKAKDGNVTYRGSVRLDTRIYPLLNVKVVSSGANITIIDADMADFLPCPKENRPSANNTTITDADMAEPKFCPARINETAIVGHITVTTAPTDAGRIGKGLLMINSGRYSGNYTVLLDMRPPSPPQEKEGMSDPVR